MGQAGQEFRISSGVGTQRMSGVRRHGPNYGKDWLDCQRIYLYIDRYICLPRLPSLPSSTLPSKTPVFAYAANPFTTWKVSVPSALTQGCSSPTRPVIIAANAFTPQNSPSWP